MSAEKITCQALTKAGKRCKNAPQAGSAYCHLHQTAVPPTKPDFGEFVQELNQAAEKLRAAEPEFSPPPFSPLNLLQLIRENLDRFTPDAQRELLHELQESLQGARPKDLLDPATWKGLAYLLAHSLQSESAAVRERVNKQLVRLPGGETLVSMQEMLEGASPKDLLDPETWKGMWYLVNYSLQNQAQDVKRRILGESDAA